MEKKKEVSCLNFFCEILFPSAWFSKYTFSAADRDSRETVQLTFDCDADATRTPRGVCPRLGGNFPNLVNFDPLTGKK